MVDVLMVVMLVLFSFVSAFVIGVLVEFVKIFRSKRFYLGENDWDKWQKCRDASDDNFWLGDDK